MQNIVPNIENMINIVTKKCIKDGCNKCGNYNVPNEIKGIYCLDRKEDNMIDVKHKRCIFNACITRPSFNIEGEKKRYIAKNIKKKI